MSEYLCKQALRLKYYPHVCSPRLRYTPDLRKNKISRTLFVQALSEGTSGTIHRPFSNRGNQITAIKHFKIFNCSEPVACHHGSHATSTINLVTLGLLAMAYYCV